MRVIALVLLVLSASLGGCANFKVVSEFAQATKQVTVPVRDEIKFISATCIQEAGLRSGFELDAEFKRITECRGTDKVLNALQTETVGVLDLYASALLALADDQKFDLSPSIDATTSKLAAIKVQDGDSLVSKAQAGALSKVLSLIADVWVQREREKGLRKLVDASPDLADLARTLATFFKAKNGGPAPYAQLIELSQGEAESVNRALKSPAIINADPIRAAELRMQQWKVNQDLSKRAAPGPNSVGNLMAQSLLDWADSLTEFRENAFKPEPGVLLARIKAFRARAIEAQVAAQAAF